MQRPIMTTVSFLRRPSRPATLDDLHIAQDVTDTVEANRSRCIGMAANMIGESVNIIAVVDEALGGRITTMLNPCITAQDGAYETAEGCLSLHGERPVVRYRRIEVTWTDMRGRERHAAFTGASAEAIQHEIDHTQGIVI